MEEEMVFTTFGTPLHKRFNGEKKCCIRVACVDGWLGVVCPYGEDNKCCGFHSFCEDCEDKFECASTKNVND